MSKYCWMDNTCNDAAKVPTCTTSPNTPTNCKPAQCTAVDTPYDGCLPVCRTSCGQMPCKCGDDSGNHNSDINGCGQSSSTILCQGTCSDITDSNFCTSSSCTFENSQCRILPKITV